MIWKVKVDGRGSSHHHIVRQCTCVIRTVHGEVSAAECMH